jgi:hypothetical protein
MAGVRAADDTSDARREAEERAKAAVAEAEAKIAKARPERALRRAARRRPWVAPAPTPQPDEWADYEPDFSGAELSEPQDYEDAELSETLDFGFSPTPPSEVDADSAIGNTNKSPLRLGYSSGEMQRSACADAAAGEVPAGDPLLAEAQVIAFPVRPPMDAQAAAVRRIHFVEFDLLRNYIGTRSEALAHFARLGMIALDSEWAFHPGYR